MIKWFKKLFSKKKNPAFNIYHPDLQDKIEFAFECAGVKYYRAIKEFTLPVGRYKWIDAYLYEVEIRMNLTVLKAYIEEIRKNLNVRNNQINLDRAFQILYAMETRCNLAFEPETVKRLASVVYFDETEDLSDFDQDYAQQKIKRWTRNENYDFFLTRPISELLNLSNISVESLKKFIADSEITLKSLISVPESQS